MNHKLMSWPSSRLLALMLTAVTLLIPTVSMAEEATTSAEQTLEQLLQQTRQAATTTKAYDEAREQRFLQNRNSQAQQLAQLKQQFADLEQRNAALKAEQQRNTEQLTALASEKAVQLADRDTFLNNLHKEFDQVVSVAKTLPVTALSPGRLALFRKISRAPELPAPEQLSTALIELQSLVKDTALTGTVDVAVVQADGSELEQPVTFAGPFAANSNGNFLIYQSDRDRLLTAPRQPSLITRLHAASFRNSRKDAMALDPEHGALLAALASEPSLYQRVNTGGPVAWLILLLGFGGLVWTGVRLTILRREGLRIEYQQRHLDALSKRNALGRVLIAWQASRQAGDTTQSETMELRLDEAVMAEIPRLETGHSLIRLLAALAPMLGLLGTIVGMIATFQAMSLGDGREQLMASGIAQALVTTAMGLIVAIPLLAGHALLTSQSKRLILLLDRQAAGLLAAWQEQKNTNSASDINNPQDKILQEALL